MYPSQTSLIPVSVTLAQFVNKHGLSAFGKWFDVWYLGVPFRFVAEPVTPIILASLIRLFPEVDSYSLAILIAFASILLGSLGWSIFAYVLSGNKKVCLLTFIITFLFPWKYLSALAISDLSSILARNFLPFVFISYWKLLGAKQEDKIWRALISTIASTFALLISVSVLPQLSIGMLALVAAKTQPKYVYQKVKRYIKLLTCISLITLVLVTLWYGLKYWIVVFSNPSIGGANVLSVIGRVLNLAKAALPVLIAFYSIYMIKKIKGRLFVFSLSWTSAFLFMTFFRFISDYDFFMDWSSWMNEVEVGIVLLLISIFHLSFSNDNKQPRFKNHRFSKKSLFTASFHPWTESPRFSGSLNKVKKFGIWKLATGILVLIPISTTYLVYSALGKPELVYNKPPFVVDNTNSLFESHKFLPEKVVKRTFVSGSSTFWLNSNRIDIAQVRGGNDKAATHPYWDIASYQIREGKDPEVTKSWLLALGVSEVLVHTKVSDEYYHDFENVEKWEKIGSKVKESDGDIIYKIDSFVVNAVNRDIVTAKSPESGEDIKSLNEYLSYVMDPEAGFEIKVTEEGYKIDVPTLPETLLVRITYDSNWKALNENQEKLEIIEDPLGNMVVFSNRAKEVRLIFD